MYKSIGILLIIVFSSILFKSQAQEKLSTLTVDRYSYEYYLQGDWKALISLGKKSVAAGIDFHYLRYRMAVAYYERGNYRKALSHFQEVAKHQPNDPVVLEYLYYSYLLSGRTAEAKLLATTFDPGLKTSLHIPLKRPAIGGLGIEFKTYNFGDYSAFTAPQDGIRQKVRQDLGYFNLNLNHRAGDRVAFFHAMSGLTGNNLLYIPEESLAGMQEDLNQFQYYVKTTIQLPKGAGLAMAFHYVFSKSTHSYRFFQPGQPPALIPVEQYSNDFVGFLKASKQLGLFNVKLSATASSINKQFQLLPLAGFDLYPLGNTRLYLTTELAYQYAPDLQAFDTEMIFRQKIGIGITSALWIEPFIQYGRVSNYSDEDAYVIYNLQDAIDSYYGARINWYLFDYSLNLYYIFQSYQMTNFYLQQETPMEVEYSIQSHLFGLRVGF